MNVIIKILTKYPNDSNVLCLQQDKELLSKNVKAFDKFCETAYEKNIDFKEVAELFKEATPEYTVDIIESIIAG